MASANFMVLGGSPSPTRVISIEPTVQGGNCRSCSQPLQIGEPRVKISYPNVFVQYFSRGGSPSFFMHPTCYQTAPVDFCRIGSCAWKETLPIKGFSVNPATDVVGYSNYPAQKDCFQQSYKLYLESLHQDQESIVPSEVVKGPILGADLEAAAFRAQSAEETSTVSDALTMHAIEQVSSTDTLSVVPLTEAAAPPVGPTRPENRGVKRPRPLDSWEIRTTFDADDEDQERHRRELKTTSTPAEELDQQTKGSPTQRKTHDEERGSNVLPARCIHCECHPSQAATERQWASPQDTAKIVGISATILRSLADQRAIPLFKRPSGQRVYNLPAIRDYIAKNTLHPLV